MLGCFVGPAEAARGVPERFSFASKQGPGTRDHIDRYSLAESITGKEITQASNGDIPSTPTPATKPPQPAPQSALSGEPMDVDKA